MTTPPSAITRPPTEIFGRHPGYGFAGLGVNTAIGNFTLTTIDLSFPEGLLGLLDWQRTYNSRSGAIGALGPGWTTSFSAHLVASPPQGLLHHTASPVTFFDEDGRVLVFTPAPDGGYSRPQDLAADLTQNPDGSFTLTYNSGGVWSFDASGRLTGRSLEGQQVSVGYSSDDLLLTASHSTGRELTLSYDGNRRLTSVEASDGRVVSFGYSGGTVTDSLLESVTVPGGGVFRFESSGSGQAAQVSKITDPDGNLIVENAFDAATAEVKSQQYASNGGATFGYDQSTGVTTVTGTPTGANAIFQANQQGRLVRLTDPAENVSTFSYDGNGHLAEAVSPLGVRLVQTHDARGNLLTSTFGGSVTSWAYDDVSRITSATDPTDRVTTFGYSGASHVPSRVTAADGGITQFTVDNGLVTEQTDADGNSTAFGFDATGDLVSVTNPAGETTRIGHDAAGNRTEIIAPSGDVTQYAYDAAGRVTAITDPAGGVTSYRYSAAGLPLETTDPTGAATINTYTAAGLLASVTDPLGRSVGYSYDTDNNLTAVTGPGGDVTRLGYDILDRLTSITDPTNVTTQLGYDADGNNITEETPAGTIRTSYDSRGNPVSVTDPLGATAQFGYDASDRLVTATDQLGGVWQTSYDAAGRAISVTDPAAATAELQWTAAGRPAAVKDPLGRTTGFAHDAAGRVTQVTNPEGGVTQYAYDLNGRRVSTTSPGGLVTRSAYDANGRLVATVDPRGWITRCEYDARGQRIATITPGGVITRFRYNAAGQLTETIDGNDNVTQYTYDNSGHVSAIIDAKGAVNRYTYDADGRMISSTDPLGRETTRAYDAAGNLVAITDPSGQVQHMAYDADQRLIQRTGPDGEEVSFGYDAAGRLTSMTDSTGTTRYGYDPNGRLATVTDPVGEVLSMGYDAAGQMISLAYPDGHQASYQYDRNGRLIGLHDSRAGDAVYALDPDGQLLTEQLPQRLARRYHHEDGLLRRFLAIRDGHPVRDMSLTYDPDGRILTERERDEIREYRYDRIGQLVSIARADHREPARSSRPEPQPDAVHLTYDAVGNRVAMRHGNVEAHYRYDAADQLVESQIRGRRTEYDYDSSGRLTEEAEGAQRRIISYDGFGRPAEILRTEGEATTERIKVTFSGDGKPAALTLTTVDEQRNEERAASVRYRWNQDSIPQVLTQRVAAELDDAEREHPGRLDADFTYGYGRTFATWHDGAAVIAMDAFASATRTEETAPWAQSRRYDAFGVPEPDGTDDAGSGRRGPRSPELPRFGYRGELALGPIIYLRARTYDAALGRFTTRDPIPPPVRAGDTGNPYAYADNDPVNFTDPLGTLAIGVSLAGEAAVAAEQAAAVSRIQHSATKTTSLTASMVSDALGAGGPEVSAMHYWAVEAAEEQLEVQMARKWGLTLGQAAGAMRTEANIPGASKKTKGNRGSADIMFTHAPKAYIWEMKADTVGGSPVAAAVQAAQEVKDYIAVYDQDLGKVQKKKHPGITGAPGDPLSAPVAIEIPLFPLNPPWMVYSPIPWLASGALLYGEVPKGHPKPPYPPVPVRQPVRVRVRAPQPEHHWWQNFEPWHWHLPDIPIGPAIPLNFNLRLTGAAAVIAAIIVIIVLSPVGA
jgi:RHS repeat-associated protein